MTISLRFFLADGFPTKSHFGVDAEQILKTIGERKIPSNLVFQGWMGNPVPGTTYELTENMVIPLSGSRTEYFNAGEFMVFQILDQSPH